MNKMYSLNLHLQINNILPKTGFDMTEKDNSLYARLIANAEAIHSLYKNLYGDNEKSNAAFNKLLQVIVDAYNNRSDALKEKDKLKSEHWFLSNEITGMSLYVDRFCGKIKNLGEKLGYFKNLGVNFLHLMPIFQSPKNESDGGYAVSDFRKVDERFGTLEDLKNLQQKMGDENMYLMIDIVLNHTSHNHEWAQKAKIGDKKYQQYYFMYDDRQVPDEFEKTMPDIFPESAPGNFTYIPDCDKWVMTVFHNYQWDLNYANPQVLLEMIENIFFYANLGVDILRIDAPAFIWKQIGTTCQNLSQAHCILQLIKQCVLIAAPGMALLGEAIVAPKDIIQYFGTENFTAKECDVAYNATQMALQWDAVATGDTRIMLAAQHEILKKPFGTTWINYTRCHDDIGLGYDDYMIELSGFNPFEHRKFLKEYYSGNYYSSPARGALFSVNPKTQDARISGSLASLCGLEKAIEENNEHDIKISIQKILIMQAHSFFIGGIPMIFYGDEAGYTNDYSYLNEEGKSYDNRWMHRPRIDWGKNKKIETDGTIEQQIFSATKKLISIRKKLPVVADHKNITWLSPHNMHVAGCLRSSEKQNLYCLFNFSDQTTSLTWYAFKEHGKTPEKIYDHWSEKYFLIGKDSEHLKFEPYAFYLFEDLSPALSKGVGEFQKL